MAFYECNFLFILIDKFLKKCIVYDSILKGIIQPVLGTFSINLADIENKTKQRLDKKFKKIGSVFMKSKQNKNLFIIKY